MTIEAIDEVKRGKVYTDLLVTPRPAGNLTVPIVVVRGDSAGPTLAVFAGIHPTEYAGVEAALRLARWLSPATMKGRVVALPFLNVAGFNARAPGGSPEDLVDVWRAFPGARGSSVTYALAKEVFDRVVAKSDYLVDLHGGELNESAPISLAWYPVTGNERTDEASKSLANAFLPDYLLDASRIWLDDRSAGLPEGLLIHEAAKKGVPSIIGEAGGAGRSSDEGADRLYGGLVNVCRSLGIVRGAPKKGRAAPVSDLTLLGVHHDGLLYSMTRAGERVSRGRHLADVRSWDGTVLQRIEAPFDGIVEITVNWLPVRAGEYALAMVKPVRP